jgi:anti-anti-sigma factor
MEGASWEVNALTSTSSRPYKATPGHAQSRDTRSTPPDVDVLSAGAVTLLATSVRQAVPPPGTHLRRGRSSQEASRPRQGWDVAWKARWSIRCTDAERPLRVTLMDASPGFEVDADTRRICLRGEIDLDLYDRLSSATAPLIDTEGPVECDLSRVTFIDSSAIRIFVRLQRSRTGDDLVTLVGVKPNVARVLATAGVSDLGLRIEGAR